MFRLLEIKVFMSWVTRYSFHGNTRLSMKMYSVCVYESRNVSTYPV